MGLIFAMMAGVGALLYAVVVAVVCGSILLGRISGTAAVLSMDERLQKFAKSWWLVVGFAALSLNNGKWEPMLFFALAGAISSGLFWYGTSSSS